MKSKNTIVLFALALWFSSCSTMHSYMQVAQTLPINENNLGVNSDGCYFYQDKNCVISCDLWANGGETNFTFLNKSDEVITIYPEECTISLNFTSNMMFSALDHIVVAPHSITTFSGKSLGYTQIVDCDFDITPKSGDPSTMTYDLESSPFVYRFYLTYGMGLSGQKHAAKMDFYVSRVSNYPSSDIVTRNLSRKVHTDHCKNIPGSVTQDIIESYDLFLFAPKTGFYVNYEVQH